MGYALPDSGTPYTDDLAWFVVAIPDDPAFRRAAMGAYTNLADVWVWGLEKAKTPEERALQADARRVWLNAINATWASMGILEDLLAAVDQVEPLLADLLANQCCVPGGGPVSVDGGPTIAPVGLEQTEPGTDTTDDTTWPADYETDDTGATAFADLSAFSDYLCRSASTVFDFLLDMLTVAGWFHELAYSINQLTANWIAAAISKVFPTAQGQLVAFAYEQLAALAEPWADELDRTLLEEARAEIELAKNAIVCAMANAETWEEAVTDVQAILLSELTSTIVYTWLTSGGIIGFVVALLFRGWADPVDNECTCEFASDWSLADDFEATPGIWTFTGSAIYRLDYATGGTTAPDTSSYGAFGNPRSVAPADSVNIKRSPIDANTDVVTTDTIVLTRIQFDCFIGSSYSPKLFWLDLYDSSGAIVDTVNLLTAYATRDAWFTVTYDCSQSYAGSLGNINLARVGVNWNSDNTTSPFPDNQVWIDNLVAYGDISS